MASELLRRRALYEAIMEEYEGFDFGVTINNVLITSPTAISPMIDIPNDCENFTVRHYLPQSPIAVRGYRSAGTYASYKPYGSADITTFGNINHTTMAKVQICINLDRIDDCYIKDDTNNVYLWKGKNVT